MVTSNGVWLQIFLNVLWALKGSTPRGETKRSEKSYGARMNEGRRTTVRNSSFFFGFVQVCLLVIKTRKQENRAGR